MLRTKTAQKPAEGVVEYGVLCAFVQD